MNKETYVEVGGIMTRKNGKKYEVKKAKAHYACTVCAFNQKPLDFCTPIPCNEYLRPDMKQVIFIRRKDLETERNTQSKTV